jgi:hypothetical protein
MFLADATPELFRAAGWVFLFGLLVASRDLPLRWALLVAGIKVAIPLAYFSYDNFGAIHLSDALEYYYSTLMLFRRGIDASFFFGNPENLLIVGKLLGSQLFAYPLWNILAFSAFGPYYFSPVLFNVGLTFVAGWFFVRVLKEVGLPRDYRTAALAFFLLHGEVVAWSSVLNLKDTMAMTVTLAVLHQLLLLKGFNPARLLLVAGLLSLLFLVRFYAPAFVLGAVLLHRLVGGTGRTGHGGAARLSTVLALAGGLAYLLIRYHDTILRLAGSIQPLAVPYDFVRFATTPLPWNLLEDYTFLMIPAALHLILLVPAVLAIPGLWRRFPDARFLFLYLMLVVSFYSVFTDWQGPRQRFQAVSVIAWLQFHALWMLAHFALGRKRPPFAPPVTDRAVSNA